MFLQKNRLVGLDSVAVKMKNFNVKLASVKNVTNICENLICL